MPYDDVYENPQNFLERMDAGEFDDNITTVLAALTMDQRGEIAQMLTDRAAQRNSRDISVKSARAT